MFFANKNWLPNIKKIVDYRKKQILRKEKEIIKKLMRPLSKKEYIKKKRNFTKEAIYFAIQNSKIKIDKFFNKFKNKKILLVGSNDHTYILCKMFKNNIKNLDITFFNLNTKNDFLIKSKKPALKFISNLKKINAYDKIIISSFEYQREIFDKIISGTSKNKIYKIYDNSSRSLVDSYLIKNILTKQKIYKDGSLTKIS